MKKFIFLALLLAVSFMTTSCVGTDSVEAGNEGVYVVQPMIFGSGGVDMEPVATGRHWSANTSTLIEFKIVPYKLKEGFEDLVTSDNIQVDFDAYIQVQQIPGKTPVLLKDFGGDTWYENRVQSRFRELVRDYTKTQTMENMVIGQNTASEMSASLMKDLNNYIKEIGIPVRLLQVNIGKVNPPAEVSAQRTATAVQIQRKKTMVEKTNAENARKESEIATAHADKAYQNTMKMTGSQYLEYLRIQVEQDRIALLRERPNANLNVIMGNAVPMVNVPN